MTFKKKHAIPLAAVLLAILCLACVSGFIPLRLSAQTTYTELTTTQDKPSPQDIVVKLNGKTYESNTTDASSDKAAVIDCVWQYNAAYLSSLFSGAWVKFPQDKCVSPALYEEANAFIIFELQNKPNAWKNVNYYDFDVKVQSVKVRGDMAKVVVDRVADVYTNSCFGDIDDCNAMTYSSPEAYLLKKENGHWKIYNIMYVEYFFSDTYLDFVKDNNPQHWRDDYSFENCPRKTYEGDNYRDYIIGDLENQQVDVEKACMGYLQQ